MIQALNVAAIALAGLVVLLATYRGASAKPRTSAAPNASYRGHSRSGKALLLILVALFLVLCVRVWLELGS